MSESGYTPPDVWTPPQDSGGRFAAINRDTAGAQFDRELPSGTRPIQLYSLATPNGIKVSIMLEELLAEGVAGAEYDAHLIDIGKGDQFSSGFVRINPNSKIPAIVDTTGGESRAVFESGAILLHLAEKFDRFIPAGNARTECLSWLFWQVGSGPYVGGGFGHFYVYAPEKFKYPIDRFTMEVKRQLSLLDQHLEHRRYICGESYSIADMAIWPWYGALVLGQVYDAARFLDVERYQHVMRWAREIEARPAVARGVKVLAG
jgi:GST-like protein